MFNKLNFGMRGHDTKATDIESLAKILEEAGAAHVQLALKKSFKDINWQNSILTPELGCYIKHSCGTRSQSVGFGVLHKPGSSG